MLPRYVIHIGPLKTGSTYLQECLASAREELARNGVCYPAAFNDAGKFDGNEWNNHIGIFSMLHLSRAKFKRYQREFARINASGFETVVLSCEHFVYMDDERFQALRELTGAEELQIVYASRRWSERFSSLWNQRIFRGDSETLPEFYLTMLADKRPHYYPNYADWGTVSPDLDSSLVWSRLAGQFGRDALSILPYSNIVDRGDDLFTRFCQDVLYLDETPAVPKFGAQLWASSSTEDQEILRALNEIHFMRTGKNPGGHLRPHLRPSRRDVDISLVTEAMIPFTRELLIDDQAPHFDSAYSRMEAFADRVLGGGPVFERRIKTVRYVAPGYMFVDGVREQMSAIYAVMAERMAERLGFASERKAVAVAERKSVAAAFRKNRKPRREGVAKAAGSAG